MVPELRAEPGRARFARPPTRPTRWPTCWPDAVPPRPTRPRRRWRSSPISGRACVGLRSTPRFGATGTGAAEDCMILNAEHAARPTRLWHGSRYALGFLRATLRISRDLRDTTLQPHTGHGAAPRQRLDMAIFRPCSWAARSRSAPLDHPLHLRPGWRGAFLDRARHQNGRLGRHHVSHGTLQETLAKRTQATPRALAPSHAGDPTPTAIQARPSLSCRRRGGRSCPVPPRSENGPALGTGRTQRHQVTRTVNRAQQEATQHHESVHEPLVILRHCW
jgi:hypothetical protein